MSQLSSTPLTDSLVRRPDQCTAFDEVVLASDMRKLEEEHNRLAQALDDLTAGLKRLVELLNSHPK